jgi:hypothetical protein
VLDQRCVAARANVGNQPGDRRIDPVVLRRFE